MCKIRAAATTGWIESGGATSARGKLLLRQKQSLTATRKVREIALVTVDDKA